jgi:LAO/AO transport system kinase
VPVAPGGAKPAEHEPGRASHAAKRPEVLITTAVSGQGVPELLAALDRHRAAGGADAAPSARRARAAAQVRAVLAERLWDRLASPALGQATDAALDAVARHDTDPYAAADRLLAALAQEEAR